MCVQLICISMFNISRTLGLYLEPKVLSKFYQGEKNKVMTWSENVENFVQRMSDVENVVMLCQLCYICLEHSDFTWKQYDLSQHKIFH